MRRPNHSPRQAAQSDFLDLRFAPAHILSIAANMQQALPLVVSQFSQVVKFFFSLSFVLLVINHPK